MKRDGPPPIIARCRLCGLGFPSKYAAKRHQWVCSAPKEHHHG